MHPTRFSSSLWSSLTSSSTTFRVNLLSSFVHHIVLFLFNLFLLLRNSPCVVFVAFSRPQGAGSRVREEKEKSVQEGKETAGNARLLFEHWKSRVRLSGPREKEPRKERQKRKKKKKKMMMMMMMKTRTKKRRGRAEGYTTPSSLAFYFSHPSPHPPVCRQSSSSLGLPLRCYHRGYSSATNVRSCFPSRCSNPRTRLFQGYAETERLFSTCSICRTLESRDT